MAPGTFSDDTHQAVAYSAPLRRALSRLDELVDWERLHRVRGEQRLMRVSSQPAKRLLERLGNPEIHFRRNVIHVTGSKGKGTVCAMIAFGLQRLFTESGENKTSSENKVAVYSSPHVERITERIRLNGANISDDGLANALDTALTARGMLPNAQDITWFDVMTATCILAAKSEKASHLVLEVGMGGRHDSTNVFDGAPVTLITNIRFEHADIIGPTLQDIAHEKAGIIGRNTKTAIIGLCPTNDSELVSIFRRQAAQFHPQPKLTFIPPDKDQNLFATNFNLATEALRAFTSLHEIDTPLHEVLSTRSAKRVMMSLPGRQELFDVGSGIRVVLDGAHVAQSVTHVLNEVAAQNQKLEAPLLSFSDRGPAPVVLVAIGRDKDADGIVQAILEAAPAFVVITSVAKAVPYLTATELANHFLENGNNNEVELPPFKVIDSPLDALAFAIDIAAQLATRETSTLMTESCLTSTSAMGDDNNIPVSVVVIGSLHLAGKLRPTLRRMREESLRSSSDKIPVSAVKQK